MIIVTTIGRSGSSALMQFFNACDKNIGDCRYLKKLRAGFEDKLVGGINGKYRAQFLKGRGFANQTLSDQIKDVKAEIVKDPQFLVHPELIRQWIDSRNDLKVIYLKRKPEHIVESLKKVPFMNSPVYRNYPELIIEHENKFLKNIKDIPHYIMEFPKYIDKYDEFIKKMNEWDIVLPNNSKELWNKTFDKDKITVNE